MKNVSPFMTTRSLLLLATCLTTATAEAQLRTRPAAAPHPTQPGSGCVVVDFEVFANGQALAGDELEGTVSMSSTGANAGLAIFDSTPGGPNDPGPDPDLLVDTGMLLILQDDCCTAQSTPGFFDLPTDADSGGTVLFRFPGPVQLESIDLVDLDLGGGFLLATLIDASGATRTYHVPGGYTTDIAIDGPPGYLSLDLSTLDPQVGWSAVATVSEQPGFQAADVVELEVFYSGSVALDRLELIPTSVDACVFPLQNRPGLPSDLATGDLDRSGVLDVVVPDSEANVVLVYLNPEGAELPPAVSYPVADAPNGVAVADLNGDGDPDLAVLNRRQSVFPRSRSSVSVLLNQGDGTFGPHTEYSLTDSAESIVAADFDEDGYLEVATGPTFQGTVIHLFTNAGDGTLIPSSLLPVGVSNSANLLSSDFDGDGFADLALPKSGNSRDVWVWFGRGDGTFDAPIQPAAGIRSQRGVLGDLDDDGDEDLLLVSSSLSVLENLGNRTFAAPVQYGSFQFGKSVAPADLDGDGDLDVAVGSFDGITLFENPGDAGLLPWTQSPFEQVPSPDYLLGADLDRDGSAELLVGSERSVRGVQVVRNRGGGSLHTLTSYLAGSNLWDLEVAELSGDGNLDVVTIDADNDLVLVLLGDGSGGLSAPVPYPTAEIPRTFEVADMDGDGDTDLVVLCVNDDVLSLLLNQGDGTFAPALESPTGNLRGGSGSLAVGDWDGDGDTDAAASVRGFFASVELFENVGGGILSSYGRVEQPPWDHANGIVQGDWDLDGDTDLAVTRSDNGVYSIGILSNAGDGSFQETASYANLGSGTLASADWNGDGALDLAAADSGSNEVLILSNQGDGSFAPEPPLLTRRLPGSIGAADLDADGDLELLTTGTVDGVVSVFTNLGGGVFGPREDFSAGFSPSALVAGDLDADGRPELLLSLRIPGTVSVLRSECASEEVGPNTQVARPVAESPSPTSLSPSRPRSAPPRGALPSVRAPRPVER